MSINVNLNENDIVYYTFTVQGIRNKQKIGKYQVNLRLSVSPSYFEI